MDGNGGAGALAILLLMVFLGVPALLVVAAALVPRFVERSQGALRAHPGRSGLLGLLNVVVLLGVAFLCFQTNLNVVQALGAFLFFFLLPVCVALGLLVAARLVGEAVWQQLAGRPINRLAAVILGTLILALLLLVPILGWLLILFLALVGLGGALTALVQHRPAGEEEKAPAA